MSESTDVQRGDAVILRFNPGGGDQTEETRPAVVLQNDVWNQKSSTTIVAPATGTYKGHPFEVLVEADESPFEADYSLRIDQIYVVSLENQIDSVIGSLDEPTMSEIDYALRQGLSLD